MRLGVDARWVLDGPPSGVRTTRELVRYLSDTADLDVVLFVSSRKGRRHALLEAVGALSPNAEVVVLPRVPHPLQNGFVLGPMARRRGCAQVLLQNFGDLTGSIPSSLLIYDAIFLDRSELFTASERLYLSAIRPLSRRARGLATISTTEMARLRRHDLAPNAGIERVAYVGVDEPPLADVAGELKETDGSRFVTVGRLNQRKRYDIAVKALALTVNPASTLAIVGPDGGVEHELRRLAERLRVDDRVSFLGYVSEAEREEIVQTADALLFLSEDEGFGLPPVEAMANGTPVVASDTAIHREILGDAALYVPVGDARATAEALRTVVDPVVRRTLIERGRARSDLYSWELFGSQIVDLVSEVAVRCRRP